MIGKKSIINNKMKEDYKLMYSLIITNHPERKDHLFNKDL